MSFIDFLFSYKTIIKSHLLKKKYVQAFRKSINFPYKFLLNQMRIYLKVRKTNFDNYEKLSNKKIDDLFIHFNSDKG